MARIDKTESAVGVTRAPINANFASGDYDKVIAVGINSSGKVVKGAGQTGIIGVVIPGSTVYRAGQIADIFKLGEIVEVASLAAGTKYYADPSTGALTATANGNIYVGFTVEADRLVLAGF